MKELSIDNYKSLKKLEIKNLDRVNLITGKNNTGKSTVLEALSLFAEKGNISWIRELLDIRGEIMKYTSDNINSDLNLKLLASLFSDRKVGFDNNSKIRIQSNIESLELGFVRYVDEEVVEKDNSGSEILFSKRRVITNEQDSANASIGFEIRTDSNSRINDLERDLFRRRPRMDAFNFHLINSSGDDVLNNAVLWDQITLSDKEELVIDALKIIEPRITRLSFVGDDRFRNERHPIVKLSHTTNLYPLKAMGDGINRILNMTLALVNSDNGYLLIDEFENGLHYSVQENLWEIIFDISKKLNVQVFATTHSQDSIRSFANVLSKGEEYSGSLFRLERFNEEVRSFLFTEEEVKEAAIQEINLR